MNKVNSPLIGKNLNDLKELCEEHGAESFRAKQLFGPTIKEMLHRL